MKKDFGTDGIKGEANLDLTPDLALGLGRAVVRALPPDGGERRVLVGRDTRESGHIIFRRHASTGDGTLTALLLSGMIRETGGPLSNLVSFMRKCPQVLLKARPRSGRRPEPGTSVRGLIDDYRGELGESGRIVVRSSGTEPVERVMVESESEDTAAETARAMVDAMLKELD